MRYILCCILCLKWALTWPQVTPLGEWTRFTYPGGQISGEGLLVDGKPEGIWISYYPTGVLKAEGKWKHNQLDSVWNFYNEHGQLKERINYLNGQKNGYAYTYDTEALSAIPVIKTMELYVNGIRQGNTYLYQSGKIAEIIPFRNGKRHGLGKSFDADSTLSMITRYHDDAVVDREIINRMDEQGNRTGLWKELYANDRVFREMYYRNGVPDGMYKEFKPDGTLVVSLLYKNGALVKDEETKSSVEIKESKDEKGKLLSSGPYKNGIPVGIHRWFNANGEVTDAILYSDAGERLGRGIIDQEGKRQGRWTDFFEDGTVKAEGNYIAGLRSGEWKFYYPSGKLMQEGEYVRNRPDGPWVSYHANDSVWKKEEFFEGEKDGPYLEFDPHGNKVVEGRYVANEREGLWIFRIGDVVYQGEYIQGLPHGKWKSWYAGGSIESETNYIQGNADGRQLFYYPEGTLREERYYRNGSREKTWKKYYPGGEIKVVVSYENDKEIRIYGERIELPYAEKKTLR